MDLLDGDGNFIKSTTTDVNGEYHFSDLAPGTYQVREHQPTEYYDGGERVGTVGGNSFDQLPQFSFIAGINLPAGVDATQYDFCEKTPVMIAGNVYHDRSNDGIFDRPGEEGIGNVVLKLLDANGNDTGKRAITDANGAYKFTDLAAGKYSVMEIQPRGWLDGIDTPGNLGGVAAVSPPGDMISQIMINWGDSGTEYNFGELLPGSIAGRVVDCANDTVISNVQVDLLDGQGHVLAHVRTPTKTARTSSPICGRVRIAFMNISRWVTSIMTPISAAATAPWLIRTISLVSTSARVRTSPTTCSAICRRRISRVTFLSMAVRLLARLRRRRMKSLRFAMANARRTTRRSPA